MLVPFYSFPVPAEVLSWMENVVASARSGNLSGTELQRYVVRANLNPSKVNRTILFELIQ